MPEYRVILWFQFSVDYDVDEPDEDAAIAEAQRLNNLETDDAMMAHANVEHRPSDTMVEEIQKEGIPNG